MNDSIRKQNQKPHLFQQNVSPPTNHPQNPNEMAIESRVAAVTGANKGIGLAIGSYNTSSQSSHYSQNEKTTSKPDRLTSPSPVRNLALTYATSPLKSGPLTIYLTARSPSRGAEAVSSLEADAVLKEAGVLARDGGDVTVKFHELDISEKGSIEAFRDMLVERHPEGIDAVVNNAGEFVSLLLALRDHGGKEHQREGGIDETTPLNTLTHPLTRHRPTRLRPQRRPHHPPNQLPRHPTRHTTPPPPPAPARPPRERLLHVRPPVEIQPKHPRRFPLRSIQPRPPRHHLPNGAFHHRSRPRPGEGSGLPQRGVRG